MTEQELNYIKEDLQLLKRDNWHPKHQELINILLTEELPRLLEFAQKVKKVLEVKANREDFSSPYSKGYLDGILLIKREIYD